jgi:CheY-like chemotaxis protein/HPt (histidine-containing phosphotransfer) domain-containing protein
LLFNSFTQAEGATTRRFGGTGLGLAICKKLVVLMGGDISASSELGVGSRFAFQIALPAFVTDESSQPAAASGQKSVLLIEDNVTAREAATKMMGGLGWKVHAAATCAEAIGLIGSNDAESWSCDAVFIDCQLKPFDGWETAKTIAGIDAGPISTQTKYVMLGVNGRDRLDQRTVQEQAMTSALLPKPFTAEVLRSALEQARASRADADLGATSESRRLGGIRILVVEDNAINQQVAEELLAGQGAVVSIASDGRQGVNAIASAKRQYDIVMMDIQMPVMDGYEATRTIRENLGLANLPIVGLTANAMTSDRELCLQAGMNEHLSKPFELAHLVDMILRLLKRESMGAAVCTDEEMAASRPVASEQDAEKADMNKALERMGGIVHVYVRAAEGLIKQLPELHPALLVAMEAFSIDQALILVHTYKGTSATLGLTALSSFLAGMEMRLKNSQSFDGIRSELHALENLERRAQSLLKGMLEKLAPESGNSSGKQESFAAADPEVVDILRRLEAFLRAEDYEALAWFGQNSEVLARLPEESFHRLEAAVQDLDFEEAISACRSAELGDI